MTSLPNFFIVGAARSGTSSLDRYLSQHPDIYITPRKETHFFAADHFPCTGPGDEELNSRVNLNQQQYERLFRDVGNATAVGEASAFYLCFPDTARRIAQAIPEAKIIMILREPAARAYSAYMFLRRDGREPLSFAEGLRREDERKQQGYEPMWWYKELGRYTSQVQAYLEMFGPERVKVVLYEEFYAHPRQALREIFAFLEVREDVSINTSVRYNLAGVPKSRQLHTLLINFIRRPDALQKRIRSLFPLYLRMAVVNKAMSLLLQPVPVDACMHEQLKEYFAEDVRALEQLLQRNLSEQWQYQVYGSIQRTIYNKRSV